MGTSLGSETVDFPGDGDEDHPPRSPFKEFFFSSDDEEGEERGDPGRTRGGRSERRGSDRGLGGSSEDAAGVEVFSSRSRKSKKSSPASNIKCRLSDAEGGDFEGSSSDARVNGMDSDGSEEDGG